MSACAHSLLAGASAFSRQLDLPIRRDYIYITQTHTEQKTVSTLPLPCPPILPLFPVILLSTFQSFSLLPLSSPCLLDFCAVWCNIFPVPAFLLSWMWITCLDAVLNQMSLKVLEDIKQVSLNGNLQIFITSANLAYMRGVSLHTQSYVSRGILKGIAMLILRLGNMQ